MTAEELTAFVEQHMSLSHIYQPVMLLTLLRSGGTASEDHIAREILSIDESQIDYYRQRVRDMVGRVLASHGIARREGDHWVLEVEDLTASKNAALRSLLEQKLAEYLESNPDPWGHRRPGNQLSASQRYEALKRASGRCELCGATSDEVRLEVDHIVPRSKGGSNDTDNLQVLCQPCNAGKSNRDDTDFRAGE